MNADPQPCLSSLTWGPPRLAVVCADLSPRHPPCRAAPLSPPHPSTTTTTIICEKKKYATHVKRKRESNQGSGSGSGLFWIRSPDKICTKCEEKTNKNLVFLKDSYPQLLLLVLVIIKINMKLHFLSLFYLVGMYVCIGCRSVFDYEF